MFASIIKSTGAVACRTVFILLLLGLPALSHGGFIERMFAPSADLWALWTKSDENSSAIIDHGVWDAFLRAHVVPGADGINRIQYSKVSKAQRKGLADYLGSLEQIPISTYNRHEQFAYWVNAYNALTVHLVLQHYPVASIRDIDISPGVFADGPWGKKVFRVAGEALSLNDIEHRILRPIWRDPRVHYAVNCASLGCPNLRPAAFTAANTEAMLEQAAREYINHPRGARVHDGELIVSSIYSWFREDFGDSERGVLRHLRRYAEGALARQLRAFEGFDSDAYDWSLNDALAIEAPAP